MYKNALVAELVYAHGLGPCGVTLESSSLSQGNKLKTMYNSGYKKELGNLGEKIAEKFLQKNKYRILEHNYHGRHGEIDIIVWDQKMQELVFAEVKTRCSELYGRPEQAVDSRKKNRMENAAEKYLKFKGFGWQQNYRFDILAVELDFNTRQAKIKQFKYV